MLFKTLHNVICVNTLSVEARKHSEQVGQRTTDRAIGCVNYTFCRAYIS